MNENDNVICTRCVMDTTDPEIVFDEKGICNHCKQAEEKLRKSPFYQDKKVKNQLLNDIVANIKRTHTKRKYDCIIGVSGGVDSTYIAYYVKKVLKLRPLAIHLDNGWNSELAVKNIENVLKILEIDLITHVINWDEFKGIQKAFVFSGTPDWEIPTDHAIDTLLYQMAAKYGVKFIITGQNIATESILPHLWSQGHLDSIYIKDVVAKNNPTKIDTFPFVSLLDFVFFVYIKKIKLFSLLNYIDYNKEKALQILERETNYIRYPYKHYESIYTRFYQGFILPQRFGYDKRKAHLSSLIVSGQITRSHAIEELKKDPYPDPSLLTKDLALFKKKLEFSDNDFDNIMKSEKKTMLDYRCLERSVNYNFIKMCMEIGKKYAKL